LRGSKKHPLVFLITIQRRRLIVENSPRKIENSNLFPKRFVLKWKKRVRKRCPSNPVRPPPPPVRVQYTRTYHIYNIIYKVYIIREIRRRVLKPLLSPIGRPWTKLRIYILFFLIREINITCVCARVMRVFPGQINRVAKQYLYAIKLLSIICILEFVVKFLLKIEKNQQ